MRAFAISALATVLLMAGQRAEAQSVDSTGNCNVVINGSTTGNIFVEKGTCSNEADKAELDHMLAMLNAVAREGRISNADMQVFAKGFSVMLKAAFDQEKSDAAKSRVAFSHLESILSDFENSVPVSMINFGAVTSGGGPNSVTAGNYFENGTRHSVFYLALSDCSTEGYFIQASIMHKDVKELTDQEIDAATVKLDDWYTKVANWIAANMLGSAIPEFLNVQTSVQHNWSLGPEHSQQARGEYHAFQYGLPLLLDRLNAVASTDLYDPPDANASVPGPCVHYVPGAQVKPGH